MVKKKVSLGSSPDVGDGTSAAEVPNTPGTRAGTIDILELFFNTGIILHDVAMPRGLPDTVSSFVVMQAGAGPGGPSAGKPGPGGPSTFSVRRAIAGEEPDVEISAHDHLAELSNRWLPVPYQLSCPFAVQVYLAETAGGGLRAVMAVDTLEQGTTQGRHLDAAYDEGRPFRALDKNEVAQFFDHPETRELVRRLERAGIDKALFKLAALLETLAPLLPKIRFSRIETSQPISVSLVLDL